MDTENKEIPSDNKAGKLVDKVKCVVNGPLSSIIQFMKNKPLLVIVGLISTIVIAFLVGWGIYLLIKKKVLENKSYLIKETKSPLSGLVLNRCDGAGIPDTSNGKRFTFSFWIYIHNLDKNAGIVRHVLHRGDEKDSLGGSPTVFLDPQLNKLYISFDNISKNPNNMSGFDDLDIFDKIVYLSARRGTTVDYIPIQRWVHVGVVVNEDANGGSISSYVDGELVKTSTSNKPVNIKLPISNNTSDVKPQISSLSLDRKGNIFIGGSNDAASGIGFSGLVSMVEFFNYDLNAQDMYDVYRKGPIHVTAVGKLANMLGIGLVTNEYGMRNPIYKKPELQIS